MKTLAEPEIRFADSKHDDQARQDNSRGGEDASPEPGGRITYVGGAVDADRARGNLTDSDDINELLLGHPSVLLNFHLDKRQDSQTSAETEEPYFEE
jgi:hypothetical protein